MAIAAGGHGSQETPAGMALIPEGIYRPAFQDAAQPIEVEVKPFYMETLPVTVAEYLEFVRANPQWQRSRAKKLFADEAYLSNWAGDLAPGTNAPADAPVTCVSWFAAKAYAQWRRQRLPTIAEWERAAAASPTRPDGENDPVFERQVLQWYATPSSPVMSVNNGQANFWGVKDMHGMVWEWVLDFNATTLGDDSRGAFCGAGAKSARDVSDYPAFMRTGFRSSLKANYCIHNLGFRCAKDL